MTLICWQTINTALTCSISNIKPLEPGLLNREKLQSPNSTGVSSIYFVPWVRNWKLLQNSEKKSRQKIISAEVSPGNVKGESDVHCKETLWKVRFPSSQNKGLIGQSLWPVLQNQKLGPTGDPWGYVRAAMMWSFLSAWADVLPAVCWTHRQWLWQQHWAALGKMWMAFC